MGCLNSDSFRSVIRVRRPVIPTIVLGKKRLDLQRDRGSTTVASPWFSRGWDCSRLSQGYPFTTVPSAREITYKLYPHYTRYSSTSLNSFMNVSLVWSGHKLRIDDAITQLCQHNNWCIWHGPVLFQTEWIYNWK